MISNLKQFKADLTFFSKTIVPRDHARFCAKIAMNLHRLVVYQNSLMPEHPVLTGWARANWAAFIGAEPPSTPIGTRPPEGTRINTIQDPTAMLAAVPNYPMIWIYNNVPYIEALEDGHSKKAPQGMLEGALLDIQIYMNTMTP
jgi:hypothetical protein